MVHLNGNPHFDESVFEQAPSERSPDSLLAASQPSSSVFSKS
jgi:hypothetical protein